jgi:transcriptional regulator with XRE-family HTH domain
MKEFDKDLIKAAIQLKGVSQKKLAELISEKIGMEVRSSYLSGIINGTAAFINENIFDALIEEIREELERIEVTPRPQADTPLPEGNLKTRRKK